MTYEPYLTLPDEYQHPLTVAARRRGYQTNAAYIRSLIIADVQDAAGDKLPDELTHGGGQ